MKPPSDEVLRARAEAIREAARIVKDAAAVQWAKAEDMQEKDDEEAEMYELAASALEMAGAKIRALASVEPVPGVPPNVEGTTAAMKTIVSRAAALVQPRAVRPAREVAHERAQAPSLRFPCQGGRVDPDGTHYAHTPTCDRWTESVEQDRASLVASQQGLVEALEKLAAGDRLAIYGVRRGGDVRKEEDAVSWQCLACRRPYDEKPQNGVCDNEGGCPACIARAALASYRGSQGGSR